MSRDVRILLLLAIIIAPLVLYKPPAPKKTVPPALVAVRPLPKIIKSPVLAPVPVGKVALIFDDLGDSMKNLDDIYDLKIPVTVSVIPGLKFSENIVQVASRCGFSVMVHLPLESKDEKLRYGRLKLIGAYLGEKEIKLLLGKYLSSLRPVMGVNNHMGSLATEDHKLMDMVMREVKKRGLVFVDSRTSPKSVAYDDCVAHGMTCAYNESFLDAVNDSEFIVKRLKEIVVVAKEKGKIIVIAHPRSKTLRILKRELPSLKNEVEFITLNKYLE